MRTFEKPTEIYIPIFERDTQNWLHSNGAYSPEFSLTIATSDYCQAYIKDVGGKLGNAHIAKLKYINEKVDFPSGPIFILTENDGVEGSPIIWERSGSNINHVLNHFSNGMKSQHGRVKFMGIDSIDKVEL